MSPSRAATDVRDRLRQQLLTHERPMITPRAAAAPTRKIARALEIGQRGVEDVVLACGAVDEHGRISCLVVNGIEQQRSSSRRGHKPQRRDAAGLTQGKKW